MTAWSAARLALKIARFTPSAGSLSESASSEAGGSCGALAQPPHSSSRPSATADASGAAFERPAVRKARSTVTFSVGPGRESYSPERFLPRQGGGRRRGEDPSTRQLLLAASCVINQLSRRDVFDGNSDRFEDRRCRHRSRLDAGEYLADFGIDLSLRQDHVPGFLENRLARIDDERVGHRQVVELAPIGPRRAYGVDMRPRLEPGALEDRLQRGSRSDDDVGAAHRGLGGDRFGLMQPGKAFGML